MKSMKNLTKMYLKAIEERNPEAGQTVPPMTKQAKKVKVPKPTQSLKRIPTIPSMFKKKVKFDDENEEQPVLIESRPADFDFYCTPQSLREMIPRTPADSFIAENDKSRNTALSTSFQLDSEQKGKIETSLKSNLHGIASLVSKGKTQSIRTLQTSNPYKMSFYKTSDNISASSQKRIGDDDSSQEIDINSKAVEAHKKKIRELEERNNELVNQLNSQRFLSDDFDSAKGKEKTGPKYTDLKYQPMESLIEETDIDQQMLLLRHHNELLTKENASLANQSKQLSSSLKKFIDVLNSYTKKKGDGPIRVNPYSEPADKLAELVTIVSKKVNGVNIKEESVKSEKLKQEFEGHSEISQVEQFKCDSIFDELEASTSNVLEIKSSGDRKYRHQNLMEERGDFMDKMRNLMVSMNQEELENARNTNQNQRSNFSSTLDLMPKPSKINSFSRTDRVSNTDMSVDNSAKNRTMNISMTLLLEEIEKVKKKLKELEENMKTKGGNSLLRECESVSYNISEIESSFKDLSHLN